MTPFRQVIREGDVGRDVLAVKRAYIAMKAKGYSTLAKTKTAGHAFATVTRTLQHDHGLHIDGVYGPTTHQIVASHFDAYGAMLYRTAKIRNPPGSYVNPFQHARVEPGRIDMGVDYHGTGPIVAIGDCVVVGVGGSGWPGGVYILYRLINGIHAGRYVYVAEAVHPVVHAGQTLRAGQEVCYFGVDAAPGFFPGIETGWGSSIVNLTYAAVTTGYSGVGETPAGRAFARLLHQLGAPVVENTGPGPTFP